MEKDIPYVRVGMFVVAAIIMMITLALFLAFKNMDTQEQAMYSIPTEETISGLTVGSPVKYHGLQVGSVTNIKITDPSAADSNDSLVVIIKINADTPVNTSTEAIFEPAGITGQLYVNLITDTEVAPPLTKKYDGLLAIQNAPGMLKKYSIQLTELFKNVTTISKKVDKLLSDENIHNVSESISGMNQLIKSLNQQADELTPAFKKVGVAMDQGQATLKDISNTAKSITEITDHLNQQLKAGTYQIKPEIEKLKNEISRTAQDADALIKRVDSIMLQLEMNPMNFMLNGTNLQAGPGEEPR